MKITGFRIEEYWAPLDRLVGDANMPGGVPVLPCSIVFVETDEDVTGIALGHSASGVPALFPLIEGADPREPVGLWRRINDYLHKAGNEGAASAALSAIDVALWDLKAKLAGQPLWQTLGAREGRVKAYASGLDYCLDDDALFTFYRRMAEAGVTAGKLKVGLDVEADLRRLEIVREALSVASPRPQLMVDANEYWSPKQAVRYVRRLEASFDLLWVEEPARRWDAEGLSLVSRQIRAGVATAENLHSLEQLAPLITGQAVDVVTVAYCLSGVTGCLQAARLASLYGVAVSMINAQANFMAHVAAALPNHNMMEVADPGREQCLEFDNRIEDGFIVMGDSPGLGIRVDEAALAALQANPPDGVGAFPFPRREGAGLYVVPPGDHEVPWRRGP